MSPQGQVGRTGASARKARVPGGPQRGQPRGWTVPHREGDLAVGLSGRRLSGRGQPRGSGATQSSIGNRINRHGRKAEPRSGAAAPSGAPAVATGIASLPGDAVIGRDGRAGRPPFSHAPGATLAPGASGSSFAGHRRVLGPCVPGAPLSIQNLSTKATEFCGDTCLGPRCWGPCRFLCDGAVTPARVTPAANRRPREAPTGPVIGSRLFQ